MPTESMQPNRPMRIYTNSPKHVLCHHVFAIAISNDNDLEYLTIDGLFHGAKTVMYAEKLINGTWYAIESRNSNKPEVK